MKLRILLASIALSALGSAASALCPAAPVASPNDTVLKMQSSATSPGLGSVSALGNKSREEGSVVYDSANKMLVVCDGSAWMALKIKGQGGAPTEACQSGAVGSKCSDGSYYVGKTVGNRRMYVAGSNSGSHPWRKYHNSVDDNGRFTTNSANKVIEYFNPDSTHNDGYFNTSRLSNREEAATACKAKGPDWYLPSRVEMDMITGNVGKFPGSGLSSSTEYWTSTNWIVNSNNDRHLAASSKNGNSSYHPFDSYGLTVTLPVRCVRREDVPPAP